MYLLDSSVDTGATSITTDSKNQLRTSYIDRTEFDKYCNISIVFGQNVTTDKSEDAWGDTESEGVRMIRKIALIVALVAAIGGVWAILFAKKA